MAPTRQAMVGDLVEQDDLGNALALQQVSFSAARMVGPAAAGALIAWPAVGVGGVYVMASVLMALAALWVSRLPAGEATPSGGSPVADLVEGVRYIRSRPSLWILALTAYAAALTVFPYFVFLPAVVKDLFDRGPLELGIANAAAAVGSFTASLVVASLVGRERAWELHAWAAIAFALLLALFALAPAYWVALVVIIGVGAAEVSFFSLNVSLAITYADRAFNGRVQSLLLWSFSLLGLISLPLGLLADAIGIRQMLLAQSLIGVSLFAGLRLYARRIEARADARPPAGADDAAVAGAGGGEPGRGAAAAS